MQISPGAPPSLPLPSLGSGGFLLLGDTGVLFASFLFPPWVTGSELVHTDDGKKRAEKCQCLKHSGCGRGTAALGGGQRALWVQSTSWAPFSTRPSVSARALGRISSLLPLSREPNTSFAQNLVVNDPHVSCCTHRVLLGADALGCEPPLGTQVLLKTQGSKIFVSIHKYKKEIMLQAVAEMLSNGLIQ